MGQYTNGNLVLASQLPLASTAAKGAVQYSTAVLTNQAAPGTGQAYTNASAGPQNVYVNLQGVTLTSAVVTRGASNGTIAGAATAGSLDCLLNPGDSLTLNYSVGAPQLVIEQMS